jgi:gas vesicle protein
VLLAPDEGSRTRKRVRRGLRTLSGDAAARITQLQREIKRRKNQSRREKRMIALAGVLVGAGVAALLTPRGAEVRTRLGGTLSRIKVGAIDRIDRLRAQGEPAGNASEEVRQVRSVQELGRDPNSVF